jgi:hypothetical protein
LHDVLPLPTDAKEIQYDDFFESIEFKSPSNVKTIADFLTQELGKRNWTKEATEFDLENFVRLKFTQGTSSLAIDIRRDDMGSEVEISTKGMQWDGIKAEIERAEKAAEQAADDESQDEDEDQPAALPQRKEKPKQGIEKLPKLPNEGTVEMNGTSYKLTSVIAYEVFEDGHWSTKILATQRPIKQETLLASLKKNGTDMNKDGIQLSWPQPYLQVKLDEDDQLTRLGLQADDTPGGGSGDEQEGNALVEDGRARGTVRLKQPGSFFDKVYTAELSFDVTVLTRDSIASKRLTDAPKLPTSGKLTIGNQTYKLNNAVAYQMKQFDEPMTSVVLSEKPLNMAKLKAAMGKKAADDYFEFIPQVRLLIDAADNVSSISIWADNTSISTNGKLAGDIVIEDGRARGTVKTTKPDDYSFEVSFDVSVLGAPAAGAKPPPGGLVADSYEGLPIPEERMSVQKETSNFRTQISVTVDAQIKAVVDFYRRELPSGAWGEWKENAAAAKVEQDSAKLAFSSPSGNLIVELQASGGEVSISLITRDAQAAKAAGLLPAPGKARLIVANLSEKESVITINKREYKIKAGAGAQDPKDGVKWEVGPGKYVVESKSPGESAQVETLMLGADETWGVMIGPTGSYLTVQLY